MNNKCACGGTMLYWYNTICDFSRRCDKCKRVVKQRKRIAKNKQVKE